MFYLIRTVVTVASSATGVSVIPNSKIVAVRQRREPLLDFMGAIMQRLTVKRFDVQYNSLDETISFIAKSSWEGAEDHITYEIIRR